LNKQLFNRIFNLVGRRAITVYIAIFLLSLLCVDYGRIGYHVKAVTLSRFMPGSFIDLIEFAKNPKRIQEFKLEEYVQYYEKVVDFLPMARGETYEILGFCYYYLGQYRQSLTAYIKAERINPEFFWPHYNLGVIYFQRGYYEKSIMSFEKALATKLSDNFDVINSSKVFNPILMSSYQFTSETMLRLKTAYRDSHVLLVLSYYNLHNFAEMFQCARTAIASNLNDDGSFYYYAGLAAYKMGLYKESAYFLQEYTAKNSDFANAFYYLGLSLRALGNEDLSVKALGRAKLLRLTEGSEILMAGDVRLQMF